MSQHDHRLSADAVALVGTTVEPQFKPERPSDAWRVAMVRPNLEKEAAGELHKEGFLVFVPLEFVTIVVKGGRKVRRPSVMIPGYVFVRTDAKNWGEAARLPGVIRMVGQFNDGGPPCLPTGFIEYWMSVGVRPMMQQGAVPQVKWRMRLASGDYAGTIARLNGIDKRGRLVILMHLLGKEHICTLPHSTQVEFLGPD